AHGHLLGVDGAGLFRSVSYGSSCSSPAGASPVTASPPPGSPGSPGTPESWVTCTSSKGSSGSAHGKATYQSRATVAAASSTEPISLPARPNGSLRQMKAYIGSASQ